MVSFTQLIENFSYILSTSQHTLRRRECFRCGLRRGSHFNFMESETSLCFWAQADVLGSPDHQIASFFVSHTVNVTTILAFFLLSRKNGEKKNISESSVSHWLCIELFWKGGSVIFGFYLVSRCLSATLYFVRNQSPMWQETVLFEHKVIRKVLSLNKKILWSARDSLTKSMKNMNPTFNYMMLLGCFPLTMVYFSLFLHVPSLLKYS